MAARPRTFARPARCLAAAALAGFPPAGAAHGFGLRFDLALPLWLWMAGAGATVVLSFVMVADVLRPADPMAAYPRFDLRRVRAVRALARRPTLEACRGFGVAVFLLTVVAGLAGTGDPTRNLAPTMVWVVWWVGFAFASALAGDVWALFNPLRTVFAWSEQVYARLCPGRRLSRGCRYPHRLGVWPACVLFLGFAWCELIWHRSDDPAALAALACAYAAIAWAGMFVFGREVWLQCGECFSVAFALFARFSPVALRVTDAGARRTCPGPACEGHRDDCVGRYACIGAAPPGGWRLDLRPPGVGLLDATPVHASLTVFIVIVLSTVTFDGVIETAAWLDVVNGAMSTPGIATLLFDLRDHGVNPIQVLMTVALAAISCFFLAVYVVFCVLMGWAAGRRESGRDAPWPLATRFIVTLVPIAIAYHLAHYLSLLLTAGQYVIPLASDPFGRGWDLLGSAGYRVDLGIVGPKFVWYASVGAILVGHVASVFLAHVLALRHFEETGVALRSQVPIVALMVGYTMVSMWILAQPIMSG